MFQRYTLSSVWKEADEVISVAKLKNHLFMGVTLCMKNLLTNKDGAQRSEDT